MTLNSTVLSEMLNLRRQHVTAPPSDTRRTGQKELWENKIKDYVVGLRILYFTISHNTLNIII